MMNTAPAEFAPWLDARAEPLIRCMGVSKHFGSVTAIENLDLAIYPQEFFALLGPSGCGKTTMMRMFAGFESPSEGTILLDGQDIGATPPHKRPVNMMFQSFALFPHLTVWDNIAFGLRREGMAKDRIASRVEDMLKLTRLEKFARRKPHQISGGQRQRVALARSLAKAPKLLLLDEPLAALDKKLREATQFELMDIQEKTGTTFVIVTHDQDEAMTVASRIAVMDHGQLVQVDTPAGVYEAPSSTYVADFVGDVNLISGKVTARAGKRISVAFGEGQPELVVESDLDCTNGETVHVALRPEKIAVGGDRPADMSNTVTGRILDIGYTGNISTYHVELASGHVIKALVPNARRLSRRGLTWNDEVALHWTATAPVLLKE